MKKLLLLFGFAILTSCTPKEIETQNCETIKKLQVKTYFFVNNQLVQTEDWRDANESPYPHGKDCSEVGKTWAVRETTSPSTNFNYNVSQFRYIVRLK